MRNDDDEAGVGAGLEVEPPERWQQDSKLGFLGRDSTKAGRLVRVADLVRWVQSARGVPRALAVDLVCAAIQRDVMSSLYVLSNTAGYAEPVGNEDMYGWLTCAQAKTKQASINEGAKQSAYAAYVSRGGQDGIKLDAARAYGYSESPPPESYSEPGWPALVKRMRADWTSPKLSIRAKRSTGVEVDSLDDERSPVARVAILVAKANELFGYGASVTRCDLPARDVANRRTEDMVQAPAELPVTQPAKADGTIDWPKFSSNETVPASEAFCIAAYRLREVLKKTRKDFTKHIAEHYSRSEKTISTCAAKGERLEKNLPATSKAGKRADPAGWAPKVVSR